jgi:arsenate reductase-like glutaredoxin family protein
MITIIKDPNADSRATKDGIITKKNLKIATDNHIKDVKEGMKFFADLINKAGSIHDHTKISDFHDFSELVTSGVKDEKFKATAWYKKHITEERHHLKAHVPKDVTLIDIIEYITDCTMAGLSRSGEIYEMHLSNDLLQLAFDNTAKLLKNNIKVVNKDSDDLLNDSI